MKEGMLVFAEFAKEDGFELNRYVGQLFEYFSLLSTQDDREPTPE
ncbi:hypothetical protein [Neobacillus jeddahensis]|nr:hypothetical protein [Neobacillus jeddahensis]